MNLTQLYKEAGVAGLLSRVGNNPKVDKNRKVGVLGAVLHLSPADTSGHEVCHGRSPGCTAACLHEAGNPAFLKAKIAARLKRTGLYFENQPLFMEILQAEIAKHADLAAHLGLKPSVRLNGTSDIAWEIKHPEIFETYRDVSFYDYTAVYRPKASLPDNYHLTFSLKENNEATTRRAMADGYNIAAVFEDELPMTFWNRLVINGDLHDYRPADPANCVVGLKVKGVNGRADQTGFVLREAA